MREEYSLGTFLPGANHSLCAGVHPVRGTIPDMTADTDRYVKLLNIYHTEAEKHVQAVYSRVQQLLTNLGKPQDFVTEADVKVLCKNAHSMRLLRGRSIAEERSPKGAKVHDIREFTAYTSPPKVLWKLSLLYFSFQ